MQVGLFSEAKNWNFAHIDRVLPVCLPRVGLKQFMTSKLKASRGREVLNFTIKINIQY